MPRSLLNKFLSAWIPAGIVLLGGCGGGGSSGQAPTPPPSLSVNLTSLSVTAAASDATPAPLVVLATVSNAPTSGLHFSTSGSGAAVANTTFVWTNAAAGQLSVSVPSPISLGPGAYQGIAHLAVCSDVACSKNVQGSPVDVPVTFTVTPFVGPTPTFGVQSQAAWFEAHTGDATAPAAIFNVYLQNVPASGLYILLSQPTSGFITNVNFTESQDTSGQITVAMSMAMVKPAALGSGFFQSSVTFRVCEDQACQHELAGSPATEPITYTVFLTEGQEYTLRALNDGGISDVAWDPVGQKLYVSSLNGYLNSPLTGAVTEVDPITGLPGTQLNFGDDLFGIAASDDGSFLYVGSKKNSVVHRLKIPALALDIDIPLGSDGDPNLGFGPNIVSELAVAPSAPHTLAVSMAHPGSLYTSGTVIFDDAVARAQALMPIGYYSEPDAIVWGADASVMYASRYSEEIPLERDLVTLTVNGGGVSIAKAVPLNTAVYALGRTFYGAGRAYDIFGHVLDFNTGALLGQFVLPDDGNILTLLPDPTHSQVFVLEYDGQRSRVLLLNYDDSSFALKSVAQMGNSSLDVNVTPHLISWGTNGVAFNGNGLQILSGTFYASPTAAATAMATPSALLGRATGGPSTAAKVAHARRSPLSTLGSVLVKPRSRT